MKGEVHLTVSSYRNTKHQRTGEQTNLYRFHKYSVPENVKKKKELFSSFHSVETVRLLESGSHLVAIHSRSSNQCFLMLIRWKAYFLLFF